MKREYQEIVHRYVQFVKFGMIGLFNTFFGYGLYILFLKVFGIFYPISQALSWIIGILVSYLLNSYFVFTGKKPLSSILKTYIVYGISFFIAMVCGRIWVEVLHLPDVFVPLVPLVITIPLNFFAIKFWAMKVNDSI